MSRKVLLEKLKDYKGKELQVLREASTFAGERVDYENDLLLPPYHVHPPLSLGLDNNNGYLPLLPCKQKISDENGFGSGHVRKETEVGSPHGVVRFFGSVAKIMLPIIGVISILFASGYGPEIRKRGKRTPNQCPPGKVLVIEDGEARCLVKERVEIPFDSVLAKRDVTYGYVYHNYHHLRNGQTMYFNHISPNFISLSRDPLFFISLSLDLFSSSLSPIHRRSTVSPSSPPSLTKAWISRLSSFSSYFLRFCDLGLLRNHTKALCLSAGAGHAPMAMAQIELSDVTAVVLVDSLPLERRADPHNLHFSTVRRNLVKLRIHTLWKCCRTS
ncbi:hypothetical protein HID58_011887 [Brassica napus]|uniref:Uncharacterized protein n=1 Tax=Brassica napus TaxID=3708 RepID=A0ABQ8DZG7_BRANA|nr:hypothetical protein HID58_011887 [Brassica napus]